MEFFKEPFKAWRVVWHLGQEQSMQAGRFGICAAQEALSPEVSIDAQAKIQTWGSLRNL